MIRAIHLSLLNNLKSDDLLDLVASLSGSERRYFRIFGIRESGVSESNYMRLYDFLEANPGAEDAAIREAFDGEAFLRQLPVAKNYLYNQVLDSLRSFHRQQSIALDLSERFDKIELLYQRKLHTACHRLIQFARKRIEELDLPLKRIEILVWEARLLRELRGPKMQLQVAAVHEAIVIAQAVLAEELSGTTLFDEVFDLLLHRGKLSPQTLQARLDIVLQRLGEQGVSPSFDSRVIGCYIRIYACLLSGEMPSYLEHYREMVEIWEGNPARRRLENERYFKVLQGFLEAAALLKRHADVNRYLPEAKEILNDLHIALPFESLKFSNWELLYRLNNGQVEGAILLIPKMQRQLQAIGGQIGNLTALTYCGNMAIACFMHRDFARTLPFLKTIANATETEGRNDVKEIGRILSLVVQFELENLGQVENALRADQRIRGGKGGAMERRMLDFFKEFLKAKTIAGSMGVLEALVAHLRLGAEPLLLRNELLDWAEWKLRSMG